MAFASGNGGGKVGGSEGLLEKAVLVIVGAVLCWI